MHKVIEREKYNKEKSRYDDQFLVTAKHQDNTRNPSSPKETPPRRKQCTSVIIALIIDNRFYRGENLRSQNNGSTRSLRDTTK
jgi:hypothetical protein